MSFYAEPEFSKNRVDQAGSRAASGHETQEDIAVIENWRAAHAQLLNTFKQVLYNRARKMHCFVVQRLKRRPTIIDKLSRDPNMSVRLSQMQDIAGCRVIFDDINHLFEFKAMMDAGKFNHKLRYQKDYINEPKDDGYRGIHQIYEYQVEARQGHASENQPWNGMRVEIQYRTTLQHTWATAVETAGLLTGNNPKFKQGSPAFIEFFQITSEILARFVEKKTSCLPEVTNQYLVDEFNRLNSETHIIDIFENVNTQVTGEKFEKTSILIFYFKDLEDGSRIEVRSYDSINAGIRDYNDLEKELSGKADLVLVKADAQESMRSAYRNYFADTAEFVNLLKIAVVELPKIDQLILSPV
ncbi:MAG: RelA/SpoT domain-containing protein [Pseudomonadota bacterium]